MEIYFKIGAVLAVLASLWASYELLFAKNWKIYGGRYVRFNKFNAYRLRWVDNFSETALIVFMDYSLIVLSVAFTFMYTLFMWPITIVSIIIYYRVKNIRKHG